MMVALIAVCWLHTVITWSPTLTDFTAAWPAGDCTTGSWTTSPLSGDGSSGLPPEALIR